MGALEKGWLNEATVASIFRTAEPLGDKDIDAIKLVAQLLIHAPSTTDHTVSVFNDAFRMLPGERY